MSNKIYLDYQATTPVSKKTLDKMLPFFSENFGNPHSNNHEFGRNANEAVEEARENIADLIKYLIHDCNISEKRVHTAIKKIQQSY